MCATAEQILSPARGSRKTAPVVYYLCFVCCVSASARQSRAQSVAGVLERGEKKKQSRQTQTRDGGGGQGPHLHEQDFGRTIRGTGGALLVPGPGPAPELLTRGRGARSNVQNSLPRRSRLGGSRGVPVLVPVRASPVPSVVRGSFVVKFF